MEFYSIIVAAIVSMLIGYAWYSPALFGKQWAKLANVPSAGKRGAGQASQKRFFLAFLVALVTCFCMKNMIVVVQIQGLAEAYWMAITIWAGFVAPVLLGSVLWEQKSIRLFTINATYHLLSLIIMSLILVKL